MKVSVLTPIYNHDIRYVRQCLESLRTQTLQEIEFILIDNGSNQESKDLIDEFIKKDPRFKVIHFKKNVGYGKAMNAGLDAACGEYIGIVESDDFVDSNMYEELYGIAKREHVDLVKTPFYEQKGKDSNIRNFYPQDKLNIQLHFYDFPAFTLCHASTWSAIYNRAMVNNHSIRYEKSKGSVGQDIAFMLKTYVSAKSIYILDKPFYHYNIANENSSMRNNNQDLEIGNLIKQYISLERWKTTQSFFNDEKIDALFGKRLFFNLYLLQRKYKNLKIINKIKIINILKRIKAYTYFSQVEIMEYNAMVSGQPLKDFINNFIFNKLKNGENTTTYILGLPFESKTFDSTQVKHKHLFGIYKTLKENGSKTYYVFGIPMLKKTLITEKEKPSTERREEKEMDSLVKTIRRLERMQFDLHARLYAQSVHPQTFRSFSNCHSHKDVVLIACGPTVKYFHGIQSAIYVGVNRSFLNEEIPLNFLIIQEHMGDDMEAANAYRDGVCTKFYGIIPHMRRMDCMRNPKLKHIHCIPLADIEKAHAKRYILNDCSYAHWPYDISLEPIKDRGGTVFSAMQFILYTKPKRIFLVGCDCSDGGHFYGGRKENFSLSIATWREFKSYLDSEFADVNIVSINPVGLKGMFRDVYTRPYLNLHPEVKGVDIIE